MWLKEKREAPCAAPPLKFVACDGLFSCCVRLWSTGLAIRLAMTLDGAGVEGGGGAWVEAGAGGDEGVLDDAAGGVAGAQLDAGGGRCLFRR